jgi:hypothetical protein
VIAAGLIDDLGYSPRQGEQIATVRTAVGREQGYLLRISRFWALGFAVSDFRVHVFDLPDGFGIDGLVGLSFRASSTSSSASRRGACSWTASTRHESRLVRLPTPCHLNRTLVAPDLAAAIRRRQRSAPEPPIRLRMRRWR